MGKRTSPLEPETVDKLDMALFAVLCGILAVDVFINVLNYRKNNTMQDLGSPEITSFRAGPIIDSPPFGYAGLVLVEARNGMEYRGKARDTEPNFVVKGQFPPAWNNPSEVSIGKINRSHALQGWHPGKYSIYAEYVNQYDSKTYRSATIMFTIPQ